MKTWLAGATALVMFVVSTPAGTSSEVGSFFVAHPSRPSCFTQSAHGGIVAVTEDAIALVRLPRQSVDGDAAAGVTKVQRVRQLLGAAGRVAEGGYVVTIEPQFTSRPQLSAREPVPFGVHRLSGDTSVRLDASREVVLTSAEDGLAIVVRAGVDPAYDVVDLDGRERGALEFECHGVLALERTGAGIRMRTPHGPIDQTPPVAFVRGRDGESVAARSWFEIVGPTRYALHWVRPDAERDGELVVDPTLLLGSYLGGVEHETCESVVAHAAGFHVVGATLSPQTSFPVTSGAFDTVHATGTLDAFVAAYDDDPVTGVSVRYVTYLGGNALDIAFDVDVDESGFATVCGTTMSSDFPTTTAAFDQTLSLPTGSGIGADAFVAQLNATGSALEFSTYLGGAFTDSAHAIDVVDGGGIWVGGLTESNFNITTEEPFPLTADAYQTDLQGNPAITWPNQSDAFLTRLTSRGTLLIYSSFLGGIFSDGVTDLVALDSERVATVLSTNSTFYLPATASAPYDQLNGSLDDAYVAVLDTAASPSSTQLEFAAYFGGSDFEAPTDLVVGEDGHLYSTGGTKSTDMPVTGSAWQTIHGGGVDDAYVVRIDPSQPTAPIVFSTYYGGRKADIGHSLRLDGNGHVRLVGQSASLNLPTVGTQLQSGNAGGEDAFHCRMVLGSPTATIAESSYFGGSNDDRAYHLAYDANGAMLWCGTTRSTNLVASPYPHAASTVPSGPPALPNPLDDIVLGEGWFARIQ